MYFRKPSLKEKHCLRKKGKVGGKSTNSSTHNYSSRHCVCQHERH